MDSRSPSANASAWLARKPPIEVDEDVRETELARLKERLNFYESFDSLIQENVSRAGDLLRHAASVRENAERSLAETRKEIEQSRFTERQELRSMLSSLLDEVTTTQVQVERLARRVADALDDLEASLPASGEFERLPTLTPPPVALSAPAIAQPLDPTPEEIGPEDPATIAAAHAAASAPPVIEAEVVAAEAAEPAEFAAATVAEPVEIAESSEPAEASEPPEFEELPDLSAAAEEAELPVDSELAADIAASATAELGASEPESAADVDTQLVTADLAAAEPERAAELTGEPAAPVEPDATSLPLEADAGIAAEAIEAALDQEPAELEAPAGSDEETRAWAASEARFLAGTGVAQGATWLNADVLENQDASSDYSAPAPQVDDAAIMTDLTQAAYGAIDEQIVPATAAEDVLYGGEDAAAATEETPDAPATALEDTLAAAPPDDEPVARAESAPADEHITEEVPVVGATIAVEAAPDVANAPHAVEAPATRVDAAPPAAEPASPARRLAASVNNEPAATRSGNTSRLPWIPDDIRPFSAEGLGTAYRRPSGTGELRMPEPSPRPAAKPGTGLLTAARGASTVVLVHGVPRATTALSLKRYLESLPHVSSVEPREYAEGILRLHVTGDRHIQISELRGWVDGSELQPVHVREDLIEVRLPH